MSQTELILNHLKKHKSITSLEAINRYGITRLAAVVCTLRKQGHKIITTDVDAMNRYGKTVKVARYWML